ncbi:MAG: hypothetical protein QN168_03960 [Armatimonadota bacterium]|nr:hypothetical protein [Armatimonadota bacterium]
MMSGGSALPVVAVATVVGERVGALRRRTADHHVQVVRVALHRLRVGDRDDQSQDHRRQRNRGHNQERTRTA